MYSDHIKPTGSLADSAASKFYTLSWPTSGLLMMTVQVCCTCHKSHAPRHAQPGAPTPRSRDIYLIRSKYFVHHWAVGDMLMSRIFTRKAVFQPWWLMGYPIAWSVNFQIFIATSAHRPPPPHHPLRTEQPLLTSPTYCYIYIQLGSVLYIGVESPV